MSRFQIGTRYFEFFLAFRRLLPLVIVPKLARLYCHAHQMCIKCTDWVQVSLRQRSE